MQDSLLCVRVKNQSWLCHDFHIYYYWLDVTVQKNKIKVFPDGASQMMPKICLPMMLCSKSKAHIGGGILLTFHQFDHWGQEASKEETQSFLVEIYYP